MINIPSILKKAFLLTLLLGSRYILFAQNWTEQELRLANTAVNVAILNSEEKEVIKYLNLARLFPQKFAKLEVSNYYGPVDWGDYLKTSTYRQSLLTTLQYKTPVGLLYFDEGMYLLANCFAKESGISGKTGHTRTNCSYGYEGECCQYGPNQGKDIVLQLLIDHDVPSLGHRKICLDGEYGKVGVSIMPHLRYRSCCVVNFKRGKVTNIYREPSEKVIPEAKQNYSFKNNAEPEKISSKNNANVKTKKQKAISFRIGASVNYLTTSFKDFDGSVSDQLSYQFNSMVGFNLGKSRKRTSIGFFGNYGKNNSNNPLVNNVDFLNAKNEFLEIEGGFLIKECLRLSGGLGYNTLKSISFKSHDYASLTSGLSFGPKWLKLDVSNTIVIPENKQKLMYRPSFGMNIVCKI